MTQFVVLPHVHVVQQPNYVMERRKSHRLYQPPSPSSKKKKNQVLGKGELEAGVHRNENAKRVTTTTPPIQRNGHVYRGVQTRIKS
jgi:hypothetical protein